MPGRVISPNQTPLPNNTQHSQETDIEININNNNNNNNNNNYYFILACQLVGDGLLVSPGLNKRSK
jgi:preprotein translocase subunit SecB